MVSYETCRFALRETKAEGKKEISRDEKQNKWLRELRMFFYEQRLLVR